MILGPATFLPVAFHRGACLSFDVLVRETEGFSHVLWDHVFMGIPWLIFAWNNRDRGEIGGVPMIADEAEDVVPVGVQFAQLRKHLEDLAGILTRRLQAWCQEYKK